MISASSRRSLLTGYALLFSAAFLVGTYVALSKPLATLFPVFLLVAMRGLIAAVLMLTWLRRSVSEPALSRTQSRQLLAQAFFGNFLFSILMINGVSLSSATASGVILGGLPATVALLSWLWLRERLTSATWIAVGFAVLGVVILSLSRAPAASGASGAPDSGSSAPWLGNLLLIGCTWCESTFVILSKKLTARLSPRRIAALTNLFGLALMFPLGAWQAIGFDFGAVPAWGWGLLLFYALSASIISAWLWLSGMQRVPASHSGVFTVGMPLGATAIGVLALGEPFTPGHALAIGCSVIGIGLIALASSMKPDQ